MNDTHKSNRVQSVLAEDSDDEHENMQSPLLGGARRGHEPLPPVSNWAYMREILIETAPTLGLSILGLILTGELLERISGWTAFKTIDELFILIPIVLNLKGNLEMNLSARLSTAANMGDLDNRRVRRTLIVGNLSLLQVQALLVSAVAAVLSFVLGIMMGPTVEPKDDPPIGLHFLEMTISHRPKYHPPKSPVRGGVREFFIVLTTALFSASASSLVLGSFMCSLVLLCRKLQLNPDNIAPPVASALGDLITLTLLGLISTAVYPMSNGLIALVLIALLITLLFCLVATLRNPLVRPIITQGWTPLFTAMAVSSGAGIVLDKYVSRYDSFGMLSIIIGGIPGSVGSIYISRLSTTLHATMHGHQEPPAPVATATARGDQSPRVRSSSIVSHQSINEVATTDARPFVTAAALFLVTLPVQIIFLVISYAVGWLTLPVLLVVFFCLFFCVTVIFSLWLSHWLTTFLWDRSFDPDTYALPLQSSFVDFIGQSLLVICYEIVASLGGNVHLKRRR